MKLLLGPGLAFLFLLLAWPALGENERRSAVDAPSHLGMQFQAIKNLTREIPQKLKKGDRVLLMPLDPQDKDNRWFEEALTAALTGQGIMVFLRPEELPEGDALYEELSKRFKVNKMLQYQWTFHGEEDHLYEDSAFLKVIDTSNRLVLWADMVRSSRRVKRP
ncbi:MAG TPA: hypothetical protein DD435_05420 [Cyanobacteria bacterium UBA8530]|nr:hypothetical protein [Cyanobacteria bacterium UBA8530]